MGGLNSIAMAFLCIVGGVYSLFLLGDCYVRRKARHGGEEGAFPACRPKRCLHFVRIDWWCQAISAIAFLAVAAMMIVMIRADSQPNTGGRDGRDDLVAWVQIADFPAVTRANLLRCRDRPGQPIWGANLAFLPVTDEDLHALLKEGAEIEFLVLTGTNVTDEGLAYLRQMPRLKDLGLTGTQITDAGCRDLAQMATLRDLSLSNTGITDIGLEHVSTLTNLHTLNLSKTAITDRGLKLLQKLDRLQFLNVSQTNVTGEGIRDLKEKIPHLACCNPG